MSYKTILAVLQDKTDAERVLDCALPLGSRFSSHVIAVHSEAIPIPYVSPMGFPDTNFMAISSKTNQQHSEELKTIFETRAQREGLSFEWHALESVSGDSAVGALIVARACDLVIVQQVNPDASGGSRANVEALLFDSGRPVLIVPFATPVDTRFRKVLIAWNGTQQAARAVFDALPFIREADETEILTLDAVDTGQEDGALAGVDIAAALARHGAKVTFSPASSGELGVGAAIERQIASSKAELLVMGAYSQSWLKEIFFGGTTRTVMRSMPVATLMAR
ncbi:universal stress protein [Aquamicrobium zhengzhouense]|uniref:Universal stress protein n=1 Tax=Aquamicrobium zhengzhouense TaxID=2781738 RepID=A0ABS0SDX1_9HYPH|nr:universal stress protein [Aquamicrobium zhengzhouense]MBI1620672.1 universal stress protein [Aquamicrobium zhengzhouense]